MKKILLILIWLLLTTTAMAACPQGMSLNKDTNTCEGSVSCQYGFFNADMRMCESLPAKNKCPKGTDHDRMDDICLSDPICPSGAMFDENKSLCIGVPQ